MGGTGRLMLSGQVRYLLSMSSGFSVQRFTWAAITILVVLAVALFVAGHWLPGWVLIGIAFFSGGLSLDIAHRAKNPGAQEYEVEDDELWYSIK